LPLPADADWVRLSINRDESGKLWLSVERDAPQEIAAAEEPGPDLEQATTPQILRWKALRDGGAVSGSIPLRQLYTSFGTDLSVNVYLKKRPLTWPLRITAI
jgi:hypothetical protein